MERELVDFAEQTLAEYNKEVLCLGGTLSRILYEYEMTQIIHFYTEITEDNEETKFFEKRVSKTKTRKSVYDWFKKRFVSKKRMSIAEMEQYEENISPYREWLEKWAAYALIHFTYNPSTPNLQVSTIAEIEFSNCLKHDLCILSTNGVLPISNVRLPNPEMAGFIKLVPLVSKTMLEQCAVFLKKAKDANLIEEVNFQDVLNELKSRTLSEEEIIKLLKWWFSYLSKGNQFNAQLLQLTKIGIVLKL
jgi:hypothetical protein